MLYLTLLLACVELENDKDEVDEPENEPTEDGTANSDGNDTTQEDTTPTEPQPGDGEEGRMVGITDAHNLIRQAKGIENLWWSEDLVQISIEWLDFLKNDGCYMEHNYDSPYGENLYWSSFQSQAPDVVNSWASEEAYYDYNNNSCDPGEMCGHYTQIVWADTTHVGCAMTTCNDGSELWMCNYDPAGNWVGEWPY